MANQIARRPGTSAATSSPSYAQRIAQRLTREEALKATIRMLSAYPNFRCSEESMLTLAEVLLNFPTEVATAAASPIHGVPKMHKDFPPNAGQISEWCERESEHLHTMARYEREECERRAAVALPPPPPPQRPTEAELDAVFARNGLMHLRPGSKFNLRRPRHTEDERREAQAILDRYAAEATQQREAAE